MHAAPRAIPPACRDPSPSRRARPQAICDKLGYKLVIDDMDFDSIITSVQTGKADFGMAGMTVTDERLQSINFSDSYTTATQVIIVKE